MILNLGLSNLAFLTIHIDTIDGLLHIVVTLTNLNSILDNMMIVNILVLRNGFLLLHNQRSNWVQNILIIGGDIHMEALSAQNSI